MFVGIIQSKRGGRLRFDYIGGDGWLLPEEAVGGQVLVPEFAGNVGVLFL